MSLELFRIYFIAHALKEWPIYPMLTILFFVSFGTTCFSNGILANYIIDNRLGHVSRQSRLGRFFYNPRIYEKFALLGFLLMILSVVIIFPGLWQYLTTGQVTYHWSYLLLSIMLFFVGFQLTILQYIITIIRDINRIYKDK